MKTTSNTPANVNYSEVYVIARCQQLACQGWGTLYEYKLRFKGTREQVEAWATNLFREMKNNYSHIQREADPQKSNVEYITLTSEFLPDAKFMICPEAEAKKMDEYVIY